MLQQIESSVKGRSRNWLGKREVRESNLRRMGRMGYSSLFVNVFLLGYSVANAVDLSARLVTKRADLTGSPGTGHV